jgi:transketolase C-terminal domain/subunit
VISYGGVGSRLFSSGAVSPEDWFLLLNQVWPLPPILHEALDKKPDKIVVVEDHFRETGLSNRIAGVMADNLEASKFVSRSPDRFDFEVRASVADWENHIGLHIRDLT